MQPVLVGRFAYPSRLLSPLRDAGRYEGPAEDGSESTRLSLPRGTSPEPLELFAFGGFVLVLMDLSDLPNPPTRACTNRRLVSRTCLFPDST